MLSTTTPLTLLSAGLAAAALFSQPAAGQGAFASTYTPGELRVYNRSLTRTPADADTPTAADRHLWIYSVTATEAATTLLILDAPADANRDRPRTARTLRLLTIDPFGRWDSSTNAPDQLAAEPTFLDLFPLLGPPAFQQAAWTGPGDALGRRYQFERDPDVPRALTYTSADPWNLFAAVGWRFTGRLSFDADRERLQTVRHTWQEAHTAQQITFDYRLRQQRQLAPDALRQLQRETQRLRAVLSWLRTAEQRNLALGGPPPDFAANRATRLRELQRDLAPDSPINAWVTAQLAATRETPPSSRPSPLGQPVRAWRLQTTAGETLSDNDLRRGWVVELAWSASDWAALATAHHLHAAARARQIPLISYNLDTDLKVARRAAEALDFDTPHLLAEPLAAGEPWLASGRYRLVDPRGTIVAVGSGLRTDWSAFLAPAVEARRELAPPATRRLHFRNGVRTQQGD